MNRAVESFLNTDPAAQAHSGARVGVPRPHESAHLHVAGAAPYVDDIPEVAGTLHAALGLSPVAFGHTGFTGTSLWMDPARRTFVLLLTNRVKPTRNNTRINSVRISLADAVVSAMEDTGVGITRGAGR